MSIILASSKQESAQTSSYDKTTIRLHWAIVVLIALQWLGAELVDFCRIAPRANFTGRRIFRLAFSSPLS